MSDEKKVIVAPDNDNRENLGAMPTMIAPDQVTSLEALVRHALKEAAPETKAHMPLVQPRTLPMVQPQKLPVAAVAIAPGVVVAPKSTPKVVVADARPASEPPAAKSASQPPTVVVAKTSPPRGRSSGLVMAFMGIVVVASAGAAVYLAKNDRLMSAARAAHPTATARPATPEETVSFGSNTPRPSAPAAETATPAATTTTTATEATPAPTQAAAASEAQPDEKKEEKKKRRMARASASEESTPVEKAEKPEPTKKPEPSAKPEPKKPEPKLEAKAEPKPEPKKPASGVDALLQQQLNSAIP